MTMAESGPDQSQGTSNPPDQFREHTSKRSIGLIIFQSNHHSVTRTRMFHSLTQSGAHNYRDNRPLDKRLSKLLAVRCSPRVFKRPHLSSHRVLGAIKCLLSIYGMRGLGSSRRMCINGLRMLGSSCLRLTLSRRSNCSGNHGK